MPDLFLDNVSLERVQYFKYLGILLAADLSWTHHIEAVCTKARKLLGLLYRRFYEHADPSALRQLYLSLVRPHLEYGCHVWDPNLQKDKRLLESVQKFALRICAKQWDLGYDELMMNFNVPSLQNRRLYHKLCTMYKIVHDLISFPRLFLYLTPIVTMPTHLSSHLQEPIHSFIHMSPVLFPHGTHCLVILLMHLLFVHLKHT